MRYIGNKTKLLGFIRRVLRARGIREGVAVDPFCGTASVARDFKRLGFNVIASDVMQYGYVLARAYVETDRAPDHRRLIAELNALPAADGFFVDNFSAQRMYFTPANAGRIEAMRARIEEWRLHQVVDDATYFVLLAALIEASDRVANTTGVYAAWVKTWQPNAVRPLQLRAKRLIDAPGSRAYRSDALPLVRELEPFDLLYLDPPYNARQYAGYYHVPELMAMGWHDAPALRGKTGLLPDQEKRTDWSRRRKCVPALEALLATAQCKHVVMSYNAEGIIPESAIERLMKQYGRRETFKKYRRRYRRYRSDSDNESRKYAADEVVEYLYCVDR